MRGFHRIAGGLLLSLLALEAMAQYRDWGMPPPTPNPPLRGIVANPTVFHPTVVVLGDSIPWGWGLADLADAWPARVGRALAARGEPWRVVDVSVPGETTLQGWARWRRDVRPWQPRRVLIAFGINDCHLKRTPTDLWRWQHVPQGWGRHLRLLHLLRVARLSRPSDTPPELAPRLTPEQTATVLSLLLARARHEGVEAWVLTPTPVDSRFHPEWPEAVRAYQREVCERTVEAIRRTARREGARLVDVHEAMKPLNPQWLQGDGVHLTAAGQARVAELLLSAWEQPAPQSR